MGFSRQEYWNVLPSPSLGDLPDPGTEPRSLATQADFVLSERPGKPTDMQLVTPKCSLREQAHETSQQKEVRACAVENRGRVQ